MSQVKFFVIDIYKPTPSKVDQALCCLSYPITVVVSGDTVVVSENCGCGGSCGNLP